MERGVTPSWPMGLEGTRVAPSHFTRQPAGRVKQARRVFLSYFCMARWRSVARPVKALTVFKPSYLTHLKVTQRHFNTKS